MFELAFPDDVVNEVDEQRACRVEACGLDRLNLQPGQTVT
jgi:hypothetical protein